MFRRGCLLIGSVEESPIKAKYALESPEKVMHRSNHLEALLT